MTSSVTAATAASTGAYGLRLPTMHDAHAALVRVHREAGEALWQSLLSTAGLRGDEDDRESLELLLTAMAGSDPVTALCTRALRIRLTSFDRLSSAHAITHGGTA